MKLFWTIWLLLIAGSVCSFSQTNGDSLKLLQKQFESFEYQKVISHANRLLFKKDTINNENLKELYRMKGISHFSLNQDDSARYSFRQILQIDSAFNFDSSKTSPKIVSFFNEIKRNFLNEQAELRKFALLKTDTLYIPQYIRDYESEQNLKTSIAKSLVFPGWGHFNRGYNSKGWIFTTLTLAALGSSIYYIYDTNRKEEIYLEQSEESKIREKYKSYNLAYYRRNISIFALATVWLYTQIDLLFISGGEESIHTVQIPKMEYDPVKGIMMSYRVSF